MKDILRQMCQKAPNDCHVEASYIVVPRVQTWRTEIADQARQLQEEFACVDFHRGSPFLLGVTEGVESPQTWVAQPWKLAACLSHLLRESRV